jgi:hypothetical protein
VALEYAEADEDRDFDAAERKMLALLQGVLDDGTSELSRAASELSLARSLAIRRGFARARAAGTTLGRPLMFSREGAMAALAKAGSVKGAAQLLGCSGRTIYRLCQKDGVLARVLENNRGPKPTVPDRPQSTISPQGETDAPLQGKVEGRVQSQRGRADEEREAAEAGAGDRLPGAGRKA